MQDIMIHEIRVIAIDLRVLIVVGIVAVAAAAVAALIFSLYRNRRR